MQSHNSQRVGASRVAALTQQSGTAVGSNAFGVAAVLSDCRLEAADRLADRKKKKPPKLYPNLRGPELNKLSI